MGRDVTGEKDDHTTIGEVFPQGDTDACRIGVVCGKGDGLGSFALEKALHRRVEVDVFFT